MRLARLPVLIVLLLCAVTWAALPACGWYWPIMGFVPPPSGCPNMCGGQALPPPNNAMLPGTFQWGYPPIDHAKLAYPGCAYGPDAFRGSLSFGAATPFGSSRPGFYAPHEPAQGTESAAGANRTDTENRTGVQAGGNTTGDGIAGTNENRTTGSSDLSGWLLSR